MIKVGFIGLGQMGKQHLVADWNLAFSGGSRCFVEYADDFFDGCRVKY